MADKAREQFEQFMHGGASIDRVIAAARQVADFNLDDALQLTSLMATCQDERFDRAAARLAARITLERDLTIEEAAEAIVLAAELPDLDAAFKLSCYLHGRPTRG